MLSWIPSWQPSRAGAPTSQPSAGPACQGGSQGHTEHILCNPWHHSFRCLHLYPTPQLWAGQSPAFIKLHHAVQRQVHTVAVVSRGKEVVQQRH